MCYFGVNGIVLAVFTIIVIVVTFVKGSSMLAGVETN